MIPAQDTRSISSDVLRYLVVKRRSVGGQEQLKEVCEQTIVVSNSIDDRLGDML